MTGTMKTTSVARRRQVLDPGRDPRLDGAQRNACDDPGNDRREMAPQPRLEQENKGEQDQERAKQSAHAYTYDAAPEDPSARTDDGKHAETPNEHSTSGAAPCP